MPNEKGTAVVVGVLAPNPPKVPVVLGRASSPPVDVDRPKANGAAVVVGVGAALVKEKGFGSSGFDVVANGFGAAVDDEPKEKGDGGATAGEGAGVDPPPNRDVPLPNEKVLRGGLAGAEG